MSPEYGNDVAWEECATSHVRARLVFDSVIPARETARIAPVRGERIRVRRVDGGERWVETPIADIRPLLEGTFTLGIEDDLRGRLEATVAYRHLTVTGIWCGNENHLPPMLSISVYALLHWAAETRILWDRGDFSLDVANDGEEDVRLRVSLVGHTPSKT